jgi:alpha-ketoglutaric semialdehyde dehydrogenase
MITANFIGYKRSACGNDFLQATAAATGEKLPEKFHWATVQELHETVNLSGDAFQSYREVSQQSRALFLESISAELNVDADTIIEQVVLETGLTIGRARAEFARTCNQLLLFAKMLRDGSWVNAIIDTADILREPSPRSDLRRVLIPIGPVVIFGASNFPLAFSTIGGDTVSALAAGCPVIVKAHPSHPGTNALVSLSIIRAALGQRMPDGVFSSLHLKNDMAEKLIMHPQIRAVGFTGSRQVGMRLFSAALKRDFPIPVYAEMSSVNPMLMLPGAIITKGGDIASALADSITVGAGQFCTNPGLLILLDTSGINAFIDDLLEAVNKKPSQPMLSKSILENYVRKLALRRTFDGVIQLNNLDKDFELSLTTHRVYPYIFEVTGTTFLSNKNLQEEIFGPSTLIVRCRNFDELIEVLNNLEGQLTATIHASSLDDHVNITAVTDILREKVGRLIFGGYPTGVEVCEAMQHGGPFPATSDIRYTAVGTAAVYRWVRPVTYQDFPDNFLPSALKNENSENIIRKVNGQLTTNKI